MSDLTGRDYRDDYPLSEAIADAYTQGLHNGQSWSQTIAGLPTDERDYAMRRADALEAPGAEWLEPWCEDHPDGNGQHCLACTGVSHDAWMHRAKAAEARVVELEAAIREHRDRWAGQSTETDDDLYAVLEGKK